MSFGISRRVAKMSSMEMGKCSSVEFLSEKRTYELLNLASHLRWPLFTFGPNLFLWL